MSARVVVLALLCLAGLVNAAYSQENPTTEPESESAPRTEVQKIDPETRPDVSCNDTCREEGIDAEECRQECNWVVFVPTTHPLVCDNR